MLNDSDALQIFHALPREQDPTRKASMAQALGEYRDAKVAAGLRPFQPSPEEKRAKVERFERLYAGVDGVEANLAPEQRAQLDGMLATAPNPEEAKARMVNMAYLADTYGDKLPAGWNEANWPAVKRSFAKQALGIDKPEVSDTELFGAIGAKVEHERAERAMMGKMVEGVALAAFEGAPDYLEAYSKVAPSIEGDVGYDAASRDRYRAVAKVAFTQMKERADRLRPVAERIVTSLGRLQGTREDMEGAMGFSMDELVAMVADVPDADRPMLYAVVARAAAASPDAQPDKSLGKQSGEAIGRGVVDVLRANRAALKDNPEAINARMLADAADRVDVAGERRPGESVLEWVNRSQRGNYGLVDFVRDVATQNGQPSLRDRRKLSEDEQAALKDEVAAAQRTRAIRKELRDIAEGVVDPIRGENFVTEKVLYPFLENAAYSAQAFIPYAGLPLLVSSTMGMRAEEMMARGVPIEEAQKLALASAAIEAPVEYLQAKMVAGSFPIFQKLLAAPVASFGQLAGRAAAVFGVQLVEQNLQEAAQDAAPLVVQHVASKLMESVPGIDWEKELKAYGAQRVDTFWAMLPMVLIGTGTATFSDVAYGRAYLNDMKVLKAAGFTEEAAARIIEAPTMEDKQAIVRASWNDTQLRDLNSAAARAAAEDMDADMRATYAETAVETGARVVRLENGEWAVETGEGELVDTASTPEAALDLVRDYNAAEATNTTQAILDTIEYVERFQEAGQSIELVEGSRSLQDLTDAGEFTQDEADAIVDTYVALGRLEAGATAADALVTGENQVTRYDARRRIVEDVSRIYDGATPLTIIEEHAEGYLKRRLAAGDVMLEDVVAWRDSLGIAGGADERSLIEFFSEQAQAYMVGKAGAAEVPASFRAFLNRLRDYFRRILDMAARLMKAEADGTLPADFKTHLARSVGMDEAYVAGMYREQERAETRTDDAELSAWVKGRLPHPDDAKAAGEPLAGELRDLFNGMGSRQKAGAFFARKGAGGAGLDAVVEASREVGFPYQTPAELLEALDNSMRGIPQFPDYTVAADGSAQTFSLINKDNPLRTYWNYFMNGRSLFTIEKVPFQASHDRVPWGNREGGNIHELLIENIKTGYGVEADPFSVNGNFGASGALQFTKEAGRRALAFIGSLKGMAVDGVLIRAVEPSRQRLYRRVMKEAQTLFPEIEFYEKDQRGVLILVAAKANEDTRELLRSRGLYKRVEADGTARSFSLGRAVPADASNVVELPDGARLVGPTTFSITAYHGTPHKVDRFRTANIGTGEGHQVFGWGLYFAGNTEVAKAYAEKLGDGAGNLYTVELLPDETAFLDWDVALSDLPEAVRAKFVAVLEKDGWGNFLKAVRAYDGGNKRAMREAGYQIFDYVGQVGSIYETVANEMGQKKLSLMLAKAGIPGIRYLDEGSRGVGEGTRNFVLFDDKLVKIIAENGRPVNDAGRTFSLGTGGAIGIVDSRGAVRLSPLNSDADLMEKEHAKVFGNVAGADRFRFDSETGSLVWTTRPEREAREAVVNYLIRRGANIESEETGDGEKLPALFDGRTFSVQPMFSEANRLSLMDRDGTMWKRITAENPPLRSNLDEVVVYRAAVGRDLRSNDFVAIQRQVAVDHLENLKDRGERGTITAHRVKVADLLMANDATEFVWFPRQGAATFGIESRKRVEEIQDGMKMRRVAERVAAAEHAGDAFAPAVRKAMEGLMYEVVPNKVTVAEALKVVDAHGVEEVLNIVLSNTSAYPPNVQVALGLGLMEHFNAVKNYEKASMVGERVAELGTELGRGVQVFSLLGRVLDTPEKAQVFLARQVKQAEKAMRKKLPAIDGAKDVLADIQAEALKLLEGWLDQINGLTGRAASAKPARVEDLPDLTFSLSMEMRKSGIVSTVSKMLKESGAVETRKALQARYGEKINPFLPDILIEAQRLLMTRAAAGSKQAEKARKKKEKKQDGEKARRERAAGPAMSDEEVDAALDAIRMDARKADVQLDMTAIDEHFRGKRLTPEEVENALATARAFGLGKQGQTQLAGLEDIAQRLEDELIARLKVRGLQTPQTVRDAVRRLFEAKGVRWTAADIDRVFREKFTVPAATDAQKARLAELAQNIRSTPERSAVRTDATVALMNHVNDILKPVDVVDKAWAVWYANVLSGYNTHLRNLYANFLEQTIALPLDATRVNPIATLQLMREMLFGVKAGASIGAAEAKRQLGTGDASILQTEANKFGTAGTLERVEFAGGRANPFNWLKVVGRALRAEDLFAYSTAVEAKARMVAWEMAKQKGLEGEARDAEIARLLNATEEQIGDFRERAAREWAGLTDELKARTTEAAWTGRRVKELRLLERDAALIERASEFAARATFNYKPDGFVGIMANSLTDFLGRVSSIEAKGGQETLLKALATAPKLVVPFVRIVANVLNRGIDYTGAGVVRAAAPSKLSGSVARGVEFQAKTADERAMELKRGIFGIVVLGVLSAMADPDDEKAPIQLHGAGSGSRDRNLALHGPRWMPYSIEIRTAEGSKFVTYKYSPLLIGLAVVAGWHDARRYKKLDEKEQTARLAVAVTGAGSVLLDQSFLSNAADLLNMFSRDGEVSERAVYSFLGRTFNPATVAVPFANLINNIARDFDPVQRDRTSIDASLMSYVPVASYLNEPALDVLGDPIPNRPLDWFVRSEQDGTPEARIYRAFAAKNVAPTSIWHYKGKMEPEQFYVFTRERGAWMKQALLANDAAFLKKIETATPEAADALVENLSRSATVFARSRVGYKPEDGKN